MRTRYRVLLVLLAALMSTAAAHAANPCATGGALTRNDGNGQGGTGIQPGHADGTGQGGTGIREAARDTGRDGTGSGGTGYTVEVEGVITGFASVCVNGLELNYDANTPVTLYGKSATPRDLAIGQVVRALANGRNNQLAIRHIQVDHMLIARLQAVQPGKLLVQGRSIQLSPGTVMPPKLAPGAKLAISGFRGAQGHSVATRLDVVPGDTPDSMTGDVTRNAQGDLTIDGVVLEGNTARLKPGDVIRAEGRLEPGRMQITRFDREERVAPIDRAVMQGLVRHVGPSGIDVNGQRFRIDQNTRIKNAMPRAGEWAVVDAVRDKGVLRASEIEVQAAPRNPRLDPDNPTRHDGRATGSQTETARTGDDAARSNEEHEHEQDNKAEGRREADEREEHAETPETPEKAERNEQAERSEKVEKPESEKVERPEKVETPEVEKVERVERAESVERVERAESVERVERAESVERVERPERTESVERPERTERPERSERPERAERPERPEHDD